MARNLLKSNESLQSDKEQSHFFSIYRMICPLIPKSQEYLLK